MIEKPVTKMTIINDENGNEALYIDGYLKELAHAGNKVGIDDIIGEAQGDPFVVRRHKILCVHRKWPVLLRNARMSPSDGSAIRPMSAELSDVSHQTKARLIAIEEENERWQELCENQAAKLQEKGRKISRLQTLLENSLNKIEELKKKEKKKMKNRVVIDLTRDANKELKRIRKDTGLSTADIFRRALSFFRIMWQASRNGQIVYREERDGGLRHQIHFEPKE